MKPMHRMRVLRPADGIYAFYDGRVEDHTAAGEPRWSDENLELGVASYAIVDGDTALIYDTHVSVERARWIRQMLENDGVHRFTVFLSHWHLDHVAGTAAFADCEVIATSRTAELLREKKEAIESGSLWGPPSISPLLSPTRTFDSQLSLAIGNIEINAIQVNIHSDDAAVLWLPRQRLLLAADTVEDTVTFVIEPEGFETHLEHLQRLAELMPDRVLPAHGDPEIIASGGYDPGFIRATQDYIRVLQRCRTDSSLRAAPLADLISDSLAAGWLKLYEPYEAVHRSNVQQAVRSSGG